MTRRERVIAALNHQQTDFAPYNMECTSEEYKKVAKFLNDDNWLSKVGNHLDGAFYSGYKKEMDTGTNMWIDDFGVIWDKNGIDSDIGVVANCVFPEPEIGDFKMPPFDEKRFRKQIEDMLNNGNDTFKMSGIGFALFERTWSMRGMENILCDMITDPEFVHDIMDRICEYNMQIIDIACSYPIDCFHFGDDYGQQKGLITGKDRWLEFIGPYIKKMYARVKSHGKFVSQHSCGDITELFPTLIEYGLDIFRTFQPEIYDLKWIKKEYGNYLTFNGGMSTQQMFPFETPEGVKRVAKETLDIMAKDGGYILAPTHCMAADIPAENVVAFIEACQNQK